MKFKLILALVMLASIGAGAQTIVFGPPVAPKYSIFKALPKPSTGPIIKSLTLNQDGSIVIQPDTTLPIVDTPVFKGLRFTGPTVLYAVNTTTFSQSAIFTGVGIDYESDVWDGGSNKWYTTWAVGLQAMEGGQIAPSNISMVTAGALTVSTEKIGNFKLPFKLTAAFIYNFSTKSPMFGVGPGVALNN